VLSLSKHERLSDAPFDKLRVNGDSLTEQYYPLPSFSKGGDANKYMLRVMNLPAASGGVFTRREIKEKI
jgi:hypothetical protein